MFKNPALTTLLFILLVVITWFSFDVFFKLNHYHSLKEQAVAKNLAWFVEEISSDDFRIGASYTFVVKKDGSAFEEKGETIFSRPRFRNPLIADDELKTKRDQNFTVFYNAENSQDSSLQKKFPTKECVYLGFLILLFFYFIFLGVYANLVNKKV